MEFEKSEVIRLKDEYETFDKRFKDKSNECDALKKELKVLKKSYNVLEDKSKKQ